MLTSFPPSPMQQTRFMVKLRISRATSAFCVGEHRHATTADSFVEIAINSFLNKLRHSYGNRELDVHVTCHGSRSNLERLAVDDETAVKFILQEVQLLLGFFSRLDYRPGVDVKTSYISWGEKTLSRLATW